MVKCKVCRQQMVSRKASRPFSKKGTAGFLLFASYAHYVRKKRPLQMSTVVQEDCEHNHTVQPYGLSPYLKNEIAGQPMLVFSLLGTDSTDNFIKFNYVTKNYIQKVISAPPNSFLLDGRSTRQNEGRDSYVEYSRSTGHKLCHSRL